METDFKSLMNLYKEGKLSPVMRRKIQKDLESKKEHPEQRHFKTHDGRVFDLTALRESILKDDRLIISKLPLKDENRGFTCQDAP